MDKRRHPQPRFSLAKVQFRDSAIEGRGVFARRRFAPGEVITAYAPAQRRLEMTEPEAIAAAETKLTLLSERAWVIVPDTSVPGGWLCNHSCAPNAAIYSDREGRIQCTRPINPGQEVTIFYGWVTLNEPARDPCLCGASGCRGTINFDLGHEDVEHWGDDTPAGSRVRRRLEEYAEYLGSIGQEQVLDTLTSKLLQLRARLAARVCAESAEP